MNYIRSGLYIVGVSGWSVKMAISSKNLTKGFSAERLERIKKKADAILQDIKDIEGFNLLESQRDQHNIDLKSNNKENMINTTEQTIDDNQLLSTSELTKLTHLSKRFWECRRISGDTPPFIRISSKSVRYRWGDVQKWLEKRIKSNTI